MALGSSRLTDGSVYEISLKPFADVFILGKLLDYRKVSPDIACPRVLIVYNKIRRTRVNGKIKIDSIDWLCNPLRFFSARVTPDSWRKIGSTRTRPEEYTPLNLRKHWPLGIHTEAEVREAKWYYVVDTNTTSMGKPVDYDSVRHLETTWETYIDQLPCRIYLEICKFREIQISDFVHSEEHLNTYLSCFDIPRYADIPDTYRNVICTEGISTVVGERPLFKYGSESRLLIESDAE